MVTVIKGGPLKTRTILLVLLLLTIGVTVPSFGDTIQTLSVGGIDFTADLNANNITHTYSLTFSGSNTLTTAATLNTFALQIFGTGSTADFSIDSSTPVPNWTFVDGAKINNSGSLGCPTSSPGTAGWLCGTANTSANALTLSGLGSFNWTFSGSFADSASPLSQLDLQANGLTGINANGSGGSKWAVSQGMNTPSSVPEPASLLLLGTGITALAPFVRKFKK
jgi:hypothetical protein